MDQVSNITLMLKLLQDMTTKLVDLSDRVALLEYDKVKKAESDRKRAESAGDISKEISDLLSTLNAIGQKPAGVSKAVADNEGGTQEAPMQEAPASIAAET